MPQDFFNRKKFHSIVLQGTCDSNRMFWNVCASQSGGVHDAGQFAVSSTATQLNRRQSLAKLVIRLKRMDIRAYLIGDTAYPSRPYLLKNFKLGNSAMVNHNRYGNCLLVYLICIIESIILVPQCII